ncbi:transglycosylase domain-containing protein [Egibacter rhizosphaerae]|nr:transglycosylase domain-containing protein [Egibacter rhizosphaerae]
MIFLILGASALVAASLTPAAALAASSARALESFFDFPPLSDDLGDPWERSVITDRDGGQLAVIREENRTTVDLDEVPRHVQRAVLATEDASFLEHEGVNWSAIARAAVSNVRAGEITGGGSTITQQLVKNIALSGEQTVDRKLQEAVYAIELENTLSKAQILEAYLNEAYFGNRVYGIATAAEFYYGKEVGDLEVEEAALLAGVIRAPTANDPIEHPDQALQRRNIVLAQMARQDWLSEHEARQLAEEPLDLDVEPLPEPEQPFFVDYVHELLLNEPMLGDDRDDRRRRIRQAGLEIRTTLHPELQDLAQETIRDVLDGADDPDGVLTTIDPTTGEILAIGVGPREYGEDEGQTQVNPASADLGGSGRQPGSVFKAFMLAAALEDGLSPGYVHDGGQEYEFEQLECGSDDYRPSNYGGASHGTLDMADATEISSNVYFAHLLDEVGIEPLIDVTERVGLTLPHAEQVIAEQRCSVVLGGEDVFPLEMAGAFATLANSGERCEPHAIIEIRDRRGDLITESDDECASTVAPEVADRTNDLLREPIESGTASEHGQIGRPAAGKTGTTSDHRDAWFVGSVPQLTTAAWIGHEQPREMTHDACGGPVTGSCLPTILWADYMRAAVDVLDLEPEEFPEPPAIPETSVPDVVGDEEDDAAETLEDEDLTASSTTTSHWAPAGIVVDQSPEGGSRVDEGSQVALEISDGTDEVPQMLDLIGRRVDEVDLLTWIDFDVDEVPVEDPDAVDRILDQSPAPGTPLFDGVDQVPVVLAVGVPATADEPGVETGLPGLPDRIEDDGGEESDTAGEDNDNGAGEDEIGEDEIGEDEIGEDEIGEDEIGEDS